MDVLLSAQKGGSLRVLRLKKQPPKDSASHSGVVVKPKPDFCTEGSKNYIQKLLVFKFQKKSYMVIARSSGLIQLYEDAGHGCDNSQYQLSTPSNFRSLNKSKKNYKLFKEWKNSNTSSLDEIVAVGFVSDRYLYSCSSEGKLVFRDLVNDDADESYKVYLIESPISCVTIKGESEDSVKVFTAGKNNELKAYDIEISSGCPNLLSSINEDIQILSSELRSTINLTYDTVPDSTSALRRSPNSFGRLRGSLHNRLKLAPSFVCQSRLKDYIYKASPLESISNWFVSICYIGKTAISDIDDVEIIVCGGQFGNLAIYDVRNSHYPLKVLHLSQFPLSTIEAFNGNRYILYTDTMSKVGIIDTASFEVVNFYDNLQFGPVMSLKVLTSGLPTKHSRSATGISKFDPIYLIASTIDKKLVVYTLYDDNTMKMNLSIQLDTLVPSVDILDADPYYAAKVLFDDNEGIKTNKSRGLNMTEDTAFYRTSNETDSPEQGFSVKKRKVSTTVGRARCEAPSSALHDTVLYESNPTPRYNGFKNIPAYDNYDINNYLIDDLKSS